MYASAWGTTTEPTIQRDSRRNIMSCNRRRQVGPNLCMKCQKAAASVLWKRNHNASIKAQWLQSGYVRLLDNLMSPKNTSHNGPLGACGRKSYGSDKGYHTRE